MSLEIELEEFIIRNNPYTSVMKPHGATWDRSIAECNRFMIWSFRGVEHIIQQALSVKYNYDKLKKNDDGTYSTVEDTEYLLVGFENDIGSSYGNTYPVTPPSKGALGEAVCERNSLRNLKDNPNKLAMVFQDRWHDLVMEDQPMIHWYFEDHTGIQPKYWRHIRKAFRIPYFLQDVDETSKTPPGIKISSYLIIGYEGAGGGF